LQKASSPFGTFDGNGTYLVLLANAATTTGWYADQVEFTDGCAEVDLSTLGKISDLPLTIITTATVTFDAIQGIAVPIAGITPVTAITENDQYSGTVTWNGSPSVFAASTVYTATITLTAKTGYTLEGVAYNFFTVVGATSVSNSANSGVVTANFPATAMYGIDNTGPGGGKVFYYSAAGFTMTDNNQVCHYLEAVPADMSSKLAWASNAFNPPPYGTGNWVDIPGTGTAIGTGRKNTATILATDTNAPAAKACKDYRGPNNLTDWFLPSKDELNELYKNKAYVENMGTDRFWSSSQYNSSERYSWLQYFSDGRQDFEYKYSAGSVRAVRAF
jgi:hypothetical protein